MNRQRSCQLGGKKVTNSPPVFFFYLACQEATPWIPEVLCNEPPMELLPMVLHRWRGLWISSLPYFRSKGLETNVYPMGYLSLVGVLHTSSSSMWKSPKIWIIWMSGFSSISASHMLVRGWSVHTLWTFRASLVLYFLGGYCGRSSANKREIGTPQMYQRAAWQAYLVTRSVCLIICCLLSKSSMVFSFMKYVYCVPGAVLPVYSSDYGGWSLPLHQSHGYHCE